MDVSLTNDGTCLTSPSVNTSFCKSLFQNPILILTARYSRHFVPCNTFTPRALTGPVTILLDTADKRER